MPSTPVFKAHRSQKEFGHIPSGQSVPAIKFNSASLHLDRRTCSFKNDMLPLYTPGGRDEVPTRLEKNERETPGALALDSSQDHQRSIRAGGIRRRLSSFAVRENGFTPVVEPEKAAPAMSGPPTRTDAGENNPVATNLGKVYGGKKLRDKRDRRLACHRRLQSSGSQCAKQKPRKTSCKEARYVTHKNHETGKSAVSEAKEAGAGIFLCVINVLSGCTAS